MKKRVDISKVDSNFKAGIVDDKDLVYKNVREMPVEFFGLVNPREPGGFRRIPEDIAQKVSENVLHLSTNTAGARVRFYTDSDVIAIKCILPSVCNFSHMTLCGTTGFDLYADGKFINVFRPNADIGDSYEAEVRIPGERKMRDIVINFPLYNDVSGLYIGLRKDAAVKTGAKYSNDAPVVFYGSSITQGGCASHPGNSYEAIISRRLDLDYINLGFSGSARGEDAMAEYIASLPMSAFVYDYDHNAPDAAHLVKTHERMFSIIRKMNKDLPIVIVSAASGLPDMPARREIIYATYKNAVDAGDENVYFIDGTEIYPDDVKDLCTIDMIHPNDIGFMYMAGRIGDVLGKVFKNKGN